MLTLLLMFAIADVSVDAIQTPGPVLFEVNSDKLKPQSEPTLERVKEYLAGRPALRLRIEVHSDSMGNDTYNQAMTERRALSVAKALVKKGVDCKRLVPVGFGETRPIAPNTTAEGRAQNRRTVFVSIAKDQPADGGGKPAGDACGN